jgi:hypothetical protein
MIMAVINLYDATQAVWNSHIAPDINKVPSVQFKALNTADGLLVLNEADQELAGGLVSADFALPPGCQYFGMDTEWIESADDHPHIGRHEMDLKVTLVSGSAKALPNQANLSLEWNDDTKQWQLDPTGKVWANTGYANAPVIGRNVMKLRGWSDGVHWSCTGLQLNGGTPFVPGAAFQNLPLITTNWQTGLHPQLQSECIGAPYFLRILYPRVLVMASASAIGWM